MSLKRNTLWNLAGAGSPLLIGVITIPYLLKELGVEAFGILTLIWSLIGYFSLFDFGLGRALTQKIATYLAVENVEKIPILVKSGLLFTLATGIIGALLLIVLAYPLGYHWFNVSKSLQLSTTYSLIISSIGIPLTTLTTGLRGVVEAYEDFKVANLLRISLGIANFVFPVLIIMTFGASLTLVVTSLVFARLLVLFAFAYSVNIKMQSSWIFSKFSKENLQNLFSFGAWMTISNIIGPLMVTADRFIIASMLSATIVAYYTVPFDLLIRLLIIPGAITTALFPRLASIVVSNRNAAMVLYKKCLKVVAVIMLSFSIVMASSSFWILKLWLGQNFAEHSWYIFSIIAVGLLFNGIAQIPFAAIQSTGNARITAYLHIVEFAIYLPVLIFSLIYFGLIGAAITFSLRVFFDCLFLLFYSQRCLK